MHGIAIYIEVQDTTTSWHLTAEGCSGAADVQSHITLTRMDNSKNTSVDILVPLDPTFVCGSEVQRFL